MGHVNRVAEGLGHADEEAAGQVKGKEWRHVHEGEQTIIHTDPYGLPYGSAYEESSYSSH